MVGVKLDHMLEGERTQKAIDEDGYGRTIPEHVQRFLPIPNVGLINQTQIYKHTPIKIPVYNQCFRWLGAAWKD